MAYTSTITFGAAADGSTPVSSSITAESISFGFGSAETIGSGSSGAGAGKVTFSPLTFTKGIDANSLALYEMCSSGTAFTTMTLTIQSAGAASPTIVYQFGLVVITQVTISGNQHGGLTPTETVSVEYGTIAANTNNGTNTGSGPGTGGWNRVTNTQDTNVNPIN